MVETLCTTAQYTLAVGADPNAAQVLAGNMTIWINYAESDMEKEFGKLGDSPGLVANYATITASYKQWLANVTADRAAWYGIDQDQDNWNLSTSQSKLNTKLTKWKEFQKDLKENSSEIITQLNL